MLRGLLILIALIWPSVSIAQFWATRDVCHVDEARIYPEVFDPIGLSLLKTKAQAYENGTGRFWRITAPEGGVSHLWGTYHANDPIILDLPEIVIKTIKSADIIAVEHNFIAPSRRIYERDLTRQSWFRQFNQPYDFETTDIDPRVKEWIRSRTHGIGWSRDAPNLLTFGGLAEVILGDPCDDFAAGILPIQDGRIQMLGMIAGADILGLEPPDALRTFLDKKENEAVALAVISVYGSYLNPDASAKARATSFALYLHGRISLAQTWNQSYLHRFFGAEEGDLLLQISDDYLLTQRNLTFLGAATPALEKGGVFMAIGSFHIPGDQGMVALLRKAGFNVTRIPVPGEVP